MCLCPRPPVPGPREARPRLPPSLALYFLAAIFFFSLNEDWTVVDAAYFAVVTLSTVGYGDLHPAGRRPRGSCRREPRRAGWWPA